MNWQKWITRVEHAIGSALIKKETPIERVQWVGRDTDGRRYIFTDTGGGRWVLRVSGWAKEDRYTGRQTEQSEEFIEIKLDTGNAEDRARIVNEKLLFAAEDAPRGWLEMARGRWIAV
jgi:hypothetical protein